MAWDGATESGQQAQAEDAAVGLPLEVAARLVLPGGERAFVTLPTLSPPWGPGARPSRVRIDATGLGVLIDAVDYDNGCQRQCRAHGRWIKASDHLTTLGLELDQPDAAFLTFVPAMAGTISSA